uniref:Cyclic AMP-dependent transcription factor ATF-4 n=1 Tax=Sinocyclocheilus rhinocerous TaxID=307959 RepID=A0A673GSE6_9TELE
MLWLILSFMFKRSRCPGSDLLFVFTELVKLHDYMWAVSQSPLLKNMIFRGIDFKYVFCKDQLWMREYLNGVLAPFLPPLTLDLQEPEEVKSEPPDPSFTLESAEIMLTPSHIVLLLTPKEEASGADPSDSDSGISDPEPSPKPAGSSRTKPYSRPEPDAVKAVPGAPKVVEKKLKKMEQNKTAATRYRQKKRTEQETLSSECAELETRNRQLQEKAESISREIRYLKDLMEEVRASKHRRSKAKAPDAVSSG